MSTQRYISTSFWDDEWIQTLDPSEKLLYLYYMTNPLTNIAGVYKISMRRISFDTGFIPETITHIMQKFEKAGKAYRIGEYVALPAWPKHQQWKIRSKIKDGIISILQDLPSEVLDELYSNGYSFDLQLVDSTIIARKLRKNISGATAKTVRLKCGGVCVRCGDGVKTVLHHKQSLKDGGDNSIDNLELLCEECHKKEHSPHMVSGNKSESTYPRNYSDSDSDSDINTNPDTEKKADKPPRAPNFIKPTLSEVSEYCIERGGKVDAQKWLDYYESNGWKVGRNPMKDWRAAVRTWERNGFDRGNNGKRPGAPTPEHIIIPDFSRGRNARES